MVESGTESTSFLILLQEINDFSFDYFLSSVVEIRCHSRYCNYVTELPFKGALSRNFALNGNSKKVMKFVYRELNNCTETVYCSLLLRMARMEMDCILKHLASVFQTSRTHL